MSHDFDHDYWEQHWREGRIGAAPPNPYLADELADLPPGSALDAGCGAGAEALWLAGAGWHVTAADISAEALARAAARGADHPGVERVRWVEADLSTWQPDTGFDLVTTHYAHPAMPQLDFYERIAGWVRPGGTLLVVGHGHPHATGHGHGRGYDEHPPAEASVRAADVVARLDPARWTVVTAREQRRAVPGRPEPLDDVVVRAARTVREA